MSEKAPAFDRELSWIEFNARVLGEGLRPEKPALDRWKFLCIVSSNFDEFYMVRVATVRRLQLARGGVDSAAPSPMDQIRSRVRKVVTTQEDALLGELIPLLAENGLKLYRSDDFGEDRLRAAEDLFQREILPVLTPVRLTPEGDLPGLTNLRLNVLFRLLSRGEDREEEAVLALVPIPPSLERVLWLSRGESAAEFTTIEDAVLANGEALFHGYRVLEGVAFRVTRDADMSVDEERDEDFVEAMEEIIASRERSFPVRLEVSHTSEMLAEELRTRLGLHPEDVFVHRAPLDLAGLMGLSSTDGYDNLREDSWRPVARPDVTADESLWETLKKGDLLLHHPYDSFDPVVRLLDEAADDPTVLAIKMTLYRTSGDSPIVRALERAARSGKQVAVLVELKARFDEQRNIAWADRLERAGGVVIYGVAGLKVHAKAALVIRREATGVRRYLHLGTGNYNDRTAGLYTDYGLMTSRDELTFEASLFFNAITGYSSTPDLRRLVMAPLGLKPRVLELIQREAARSTSDSPGLIIAKVNSLSEPDVVQALYRASQAGVEIRLIVRGICTLVPGVEGVSDNITVTSIVDRYLEHSRVFYFRNGGSGELFLASADWMPRNLERRVELMFPIESEDHVKSVIDDLQIQLKDNTQAHRLAKDGSYVRLAPRARQEAVRSQLALYEKARQREESARLDPIREFTVRRKAPAQDR